ncbi:MAG: molybdopterin converting factor subunit 1 [Candidatus Bipolaricaulia bacterium]
MAVQVKVRLFSTVREIVGERELYLSVGTEATVAAVWHELVEQHPSLDRLSGSVRAAVNQEHTDFDRALHPEDEVALFPPVSGG